MIADNPFFVLGVSPDASRQEIEREAQKLLGMVELGFSDAMSYSTPLGVMPRDAASVRAAAAALRDPYRRLIAELWARNAAASKIPEIPEIHGMPPPAAGLPLARTKLGWGR